MQEGPFLQQIDTEFSVIFQRTRAKGENNLSRFWRRIAACAGKKAKLTERDVRSMQFVQFRFMLGLVSVTLSYQKRRDRSGNSGKPEVEMALLEDNLK